MKKTALVCLLAAAALILSSCIGVHLTFDADYSYDNADRYREAASEETDFEGIRLLDVGWLSGEVTVSVSEGSDKVTVRETAGVDYPLCYYVEGETLHIQYCRSGLKTSELNQSMKDGKALSVTVPAGLSELGVNTVSAGITLKEGVTADLAGINTVSGRISVASGVSDRLGINTVSGDADVSAMTPENGGTLTFRSVSGDLSVGVSETVGYQLAFESVSGKIKNESGIESRADGKVRLDVETVSGSVTVRAAR